jgi:hypothetical protein
MIDYARLSRIRNLMSLRFPNYNVMDDDLEWMLDTIEVLDETLEEVCHVIRRTDIKMSVDRRMVRVWEPIE